MLTKFLEFIRIRKRGEKDMAKFTKKNVEETVTVEQQVALKAEVTDSPNFTHLALGIHKDKDGKYWVDKINYDPVTKQGVLVDSVPTGSEFESEADLRIHSLMQDLNWV